MWTGKESWTILEHWQRYLQLWSVQNYKPITKRGLISVINSGLTHLVFVAPVLLGGRIILRKALFKNTGWDDPLPQQQQDQWKSWQSSLKDLQEIHIPKSYISSGLKGALCNELHVYCDASELAMGEVAFIKSFKTETEVEVGFVMGKSKIAPHHGHTIPRLELCHHFLESKWQNASKNNLATLNFIQQPFTATLRWY